MAENALNVSSPAQYSRFVQRLQRRYADWLDLLPEGAPTYGEMEVEGYLRFCARVRGGWAALPSPRPSRSFSPP